MNPSQLLSLDDALLQLLGNAQKLKNSESISTFEADGRVLDAKIHADLNVPSFDNSAMDGYAFRVNDYLELNGILKVGQRIPAGSQPSSLDAGHAARIFTGAPVPSGSDAVVMQEECELLPDDFVKIKSKPFVNQSIRKTGEDISKGSCILTAGQRLNPASLGLAASVGLAQPRVAQRPRVALFSTGDELIMPGEVSPSALPPGAIFNSNRFFLRHLLERLGCSVTDYGNLPDNLDQTKNKLSGAIHGHDLILTSGGVSLGEEDHVKPAVKSLGQLHLWALAIKPGKPFAYGQLKGESSSNVHFIGLPGNPVSSLVTFMLLVRPFVLALQGVKELHLKPYQIRADFSWPKADKRREFLRAKRNTLGGLDLFPNQSSGVLTSAVWGDGLIDNPPGQTISPGDMVNFIPFLDWMS
jgi:molybdopterin molybdotransferase